MIVGVCHKIELTLQCVICCKEHKVLVNTEQFDKYMNSNLKAKEAFPELSEIEINLLDNNKCC